jgi:hypothetical protein
MSVPNNPFGDHPAGGTPGRSPYLVPLIVVVAVLIVGGIAFAIVSAASGGPPTSVEDVADDAVSAAEDLDVDAGVALLCDAPTQKDVSDLRELISDARKATGGDPEVSYEITGVRDVGGAGRFTVSITTDEEALRGSHAEIIVIVRRRGDHSCIGGFVPRQVRFRHK